MCWNFSSTISFHVTVASALNPEDSVLNEKYKIRLVFEKNDGQICTCFCWFAHCEFPLFQKAHIIVNKPYNYAD